MSAFSSNHRYAIESNIRTLFMRRRALASLSLTNEEYISTFVPVEARQLFRDISPYTGGLYSIGSRTACFNQFGYATTLALHINGGEEKAIPPLVRNAEIQPDAPPSVLDRIKSWLDNDADVSRDFGRVLATFNYLSDNYSRAAIRYYWPTILVLLADNEQTKPILDEIQAMRMPTSLKPLPPELVAACRKTAATVSTAQLIPHDIMQRPADSITLKLPTGLVHREGALVFVGMS